MMHLITPLIWLSVCFLALFGLSEWLFRYQKVPVELSRKIVHTGTGLLALLFPAYLTTLWQAGFLCGLFFIILLLSNKYRLLPSINSINRTSHGSLLYPVAIFLCFAYMLYAADNDLHFEACYYYFTPVLILAVCDPLAALTGHAYRRVHPDTKPGKTVAGSISFFLAALIITYAAQQYFHATDLIAGPGVFLFNAFVVAVFSALAEKYTTYGWDNLAIPAIAILCLQLLEQVP